MPWSVTTPMSQRREFVEDAVRQLYPMRELCARMASVLGSATSGSPATAHTASPAGRTRADGDAL